MNLFGFPVVPSDELPDIETPVFGTLDGYVVPTEVIQVTFEQVKAMIERDSGLSYEEAFKSYQANELPDTFECNSVRMWFEFLGL
jgi:hypothetical protein